MSIITFSEALLQKLSPKDGMILRDRVLCGFCLKLNKRSRTFLVATSVKGKQVRITLGRWPLLSVEEARGLAVEVLRECRAGRVPVRHQAQALPTLAKALSDYCQVKGTKASSQRRYESILRTHFSEWQDKPVSELAGAAFSHHCQRFAQSKGAALVEVGRGLVGALLRYLNAVYGLSLGNPFRRLADAGLMPERAKPRARLLREADLPVWRDAAEKLGEKQRDYLLLILYTGLRRDECATLCRKSIDLEGGVMSIPDTKNGKPHSLPITPMMRVILERRAKGLEGDDKLFRGVVASHMAEMTMRLGAPRFMLHDLRKLLATIGERLKVGDAVLRRILNHTPPKSDVLHKHYVSLNEADVYEPLCRIQAALERMCSGMDVM